MGPIRMNMDGRDWNCPICLEPTAADLVVKLSQCGCSFCRPCLVRYLTTILGDSLDADFSCPSYRCDAKGLLTESEIKDLLPTITLYDQYLNRRLDRGELGKLFLLVHSLRFPEVQTNSALTFCPAAGCGAICDILPKPIPRSSPGPGSNVVFKRFQWWNRSPLIQRQPTNDSALTLDNPTISEKSIPGVRTSYGDSESFPTNHERLCNAKSPSSFTRPHSPSKKSRATRVICHVCGHAFCARCHLAWNNAEHCQCESYSHQERNYFHLRKSAHSKNSRLIDVTTEGNSVQQQQQNMPNGTANSSLSRKSDNPQRVRLRIPAYRHRNLHKTHSRVDSKPDSKKDSSADPAGVDFAVGFPPYPEDASLKRCPTCFVPIERVDGCAQMRCRSCKHTFCWYCLSSLDRDVLLRHYDVGACKGKLGHSRASILGHRIYVISVFAGFTLLFIITAPFVIMSLPCILCSKCELAYRQRRLRKRHTAGVVLSTDKGSQESQDHVTESSSSSSFSLSREHNLAESDNHKPGCTIVVPQTADIHWCVDATPDVSSDSEPVPSERSIARIPASNTGHSVIFS
ncbi:zinc finger, C3HC4 type [Opisthorchis viverrini]|uniref:RBR-type E3 ubiquitin transferase n=1 Tax=Opisthorchis viverrini TaxID=6198 RepID=A0A1S8WHP2_OPIVI|nr:zinc finger, C3HC4 type [Opisthorchis viverrini]